MLVTDLSDAEIVLGKLAARLLPVLGLLACALPLMEILTLMGGVDPDALLGAFVVSAGVAVLGSSLALLFSLLARKTHEALLGTYAVLAFWLLCASMISATRGIFPGAAWQPLWAADPFWLAFAPYLDPAAVSWAHYASFLVVTVALSALFVGLAVWRIRAICTRDVVKRSSSWTVLSRYFRWLDLARFLPSTALDWNPVFWRECHRGRMSKEAQSVYVLYFAIAATFSVMMAVFKIGGGATWVNGLQVFVGLLILSATAAASLAEDRASGSLDVLLATPLSTVQIVLGKWLGTCRAVPLLVLLPAFLAFGLLSDKSGRWGEVLALVAFVLAAGAAFTAFGLGLATWLSGVARAVGATVISYVIVAIGWCCLMFVVTPLTRSEGLVMANPFYGPGLITLELLNPSFSATLGLGDVLDLGLRIGRGRVTTRHHHNLR